MTRAPVGLVFSCLLFGCGSETPSENPNTGGAPTGGAGNSGGVSGSASGSGPTGGAGVAGDTSGGGTAGGGGSAGSAPGGSGGTAPTWGIETRPTGQTCVAPATREAMPALLSATGCADPMDPKEPARTLIPYDVASALWSDAATKHRYFALPDNTTIKVKECPRDAAQCAPVEENGGYEEPGDWIFPIGTVFVKTFVFGERIVETRLLVRAGEFDYWGYSYEWRADQTDADLIPGDGDFIAGKDVMIQGPNGMQTWHFPSRSECGTCHTTPAGTSLGPETQQLNIDYTYPNGVTGNQIETLDHIGIFTESPADMPALPSPADTSASLEERARSYMHANCSMCHRPGSTFTGFDARFSVPFADMQLCNVVPEKGNLGVMDAMRITPGDPMASVVSLRMHTRDLAMMPSVQMPIAATNVVDEAGVGVIDDWIESLTACP